MLSPLSAAPTCQGGIAPTFVRSAEYRISETGYAALQRLGEGGTAWSDEVFEAYQLLLGRAPDLRGYLDWTTRMDGRLDLASLPGTFPGSAPLNAGGPVR